MVQKDYVLLDSEKLNFPQGTLFQVWKKSHSTPDQADFFTDNLTHSYDFISKIASEYKALIDAPIPFDEIHQEIKAVGGGHEEYRHLERAIKNFKLHAKDKSEDRYLKFLLYCYTEQACYAKINKMVAVNDLKMIQKYLGSVLF